MSNKVQSFFSDVRAELGKVTWIGFDEFVGNFIVVCVVVAFASIVLGLMDAGFGLVVKRIFA